MAKPLEEVDCLKYLGSQVAADGRCESNEVHIMNEGYRAWGMLKMCWAKIAGDKGHKMSIWRSNCTQQTHGLWEVLREGKWMLLRWNVWEVWLECHKWIELGMKRCVGESWNRKGVSQ